ISPPVDAVEALQQELVWFQSIAFLLFVCAVVRISLASEGVIERQRSQRLNRLSFVGGGSGRWLSRRVFVNSGERIRLNRGNVAVRVGGARAQENCQRRQLNCPAVIAARSE